MNNLIPIEFKSQRVLITEQLAEVYQTDVNNIQANFKRNENHFKLGIHYYRLEGESLREFKNQPTISQLVSKHTSSLYLWTERGANRHCKILDTDKAWEQFDNLEEAYFRVKEVTTDISQLSPETQLLLKLSQSIAKQELANKQIVQAVQETKDEVQAIRDVITINPKAEWRKQTNRILNVIGKKVGDYKKPKDQVYEALKQRGNCRPSILVNNLKSRALMNGMAKSKVDELNILDVLENEPRLKEIYIAIVKDMAIKHNVKA